MTGYMTEVHKIMHGVDTVNKEFPFLKYYNHRSFNEIESWKNQDKQK